MTPAEQQAIALYANVVYNNIISWILVGVTGFGISALGILIAIHILVTKSLTRSRIALLSCLIITFIALTLSTFCDGAVPLIQDRVDFVQIKPKEQGGLETEAQIANKKLLLIAYIQSWTLAISMVLNDFIVVWRAWILFQQNRLFRVALTLFMTVNIGTQITDCIFDEVDIKVPLVMNSSISLDWISAVVSLAVNMFATGLIAWKAWCHYSAMKELAAFHIRTRTQNILLLLIETGALYCTIQVLFVVFNLLHMYGPANGQRSLAYQIFDCIFIFASTWYPVAVVILVNMDNTSVIESFHINLGSLGRVHLE
ncbi:hypothetical protein GYMLUDRAFT_46259 [Collybiopsis luxurians FD-317 M1]|uniref:Uncharacterized protein n=1 Tax=Collybiopsis luxurians FD-317 M1 TaxID=944289 RepID=A0A0D0CPT7_9AGAR|nr:hypothetical protein GYMLUDRAFT_46259 [Collybiopsis luxurians FD-317 M1]